ncbi:putative undecaprenyl-diphosphatase UppP [Marvinbryantia formatexigens DSM 14469]|uniref:Undecaprenyl-diphosphatase n=1 Tax=Marvinbryantia formatexigens DSM 14469 TaxID=478749 RepID=C6LCE8_9FIRM|nr:undecaprenyl-diphosphate phosphatase [Marvinbryantia formatexigens]EET61612.1 putative undecaprenyl-diphosphatase UppP [Marvinbryantia formatexigens DSM 14469]UWO24562.1 undecaprenyl-diphosphate phosphatase [Marvinbryantia formatexigens DSM 14469]SDF13311.1 undecaprenyl-diphosphatase [Marvinbryantia formatexigens]
MSILQSIFLGIVQGLTEFLPVSSSGHLVILQNFLGIGNDDTLLFDVLLHFGTVIVIICVFRKDILRMLLESLRMLADVVYNIQTRLHNRREQDAKRCRKIVHNNYRRFVVQVLVSAIPTAVIGYAARDLVSIASQTLIVPGVCLILNAGLLLVADVTEAGHRIPKDVSYTNAFMIGVAQGLSTLPGLSRSGTTIAACLLSGFEKKFAVKYSFIMAIPAILGAAVLELFRVDYSRLAISQFFIYLAGAAAAGITGYFCIRKMLVIVRRKRFKGFAVYCLILGIVAIAGYYIQR